MADELKTLRVDHQIPAKDMVSVIQKLYPKYDKTIQSKCENGDLYGVTLRPDALRAVYEALAPDALAARERRKKDYHRLTCRISARLDDDIYTQLQQRMGADGFKTVQEWIVFAVEQYIKAERGAEHGESP